MPKESEHNELKTQLENPGEEEEKEEEEETSEGGSVEIEGKEGRFKEDPDNPGEALLDENNEPIPFEEKEEEGFVEIDGKKFKEDPENPGEALLGEDSEPIPFEEEKGDEEFKMPEKFKGKKPEEIAKSYVELEKLIDKKAEKRAQEIVEKKEKGKETKEEKEEFEETFPMKDGKPNFPKFSPAQFARWVEITIEKKAKEMATKIYEDSSKIKNTVKGEIKETQKNHPLLKKDQDYTDLVLSILESAASRGKTVSLEEACTKVDSLLKKKGEVSEEEKARLKIAKAKVEIQGGGAPGGGKKTEEEAIKEKMLEGSKSDLGGLGV